VLKEKNWQFKILYSAKISSRNEEEIKTVLDEDKVRECYASGKDVYRNFYKQTGNNKRSFRLLGRKNNGMNKKYG